MRSQNACERRHLVEKAGPALLQELHEAVVAAGRDELDVRFADHHDRLSGAVDAGVVGRLGIVDRCEIERRHHVVEHPGRLYVV